MNLQYISFIKATPERVWKILTGPETRKIFYGAQLISTFEVGSSIAYIGPGRNGDQTQHIYGRLLEYKENEIFSHTSNVGDVYRNSRPAYESIITYQLEFTAFATKLTVDHTHWHEDDPSYENTKANWWLMISNIKTLAETGEALAIGTHE